MGKSLRPLDRHRDAAVSSLIPALSCRSCRPNTVFAEPVDYRGPASRTKCERHDSLIRAGVNFKFP